MIKPPVLKIRSTGADDAGTKRTCIASLYKAGRGARKGGQGGASAPPWKLRCQVFFVFKFAK